MRFVLASASPRRRQLLTQAEYLFDVDPVDIDETPHPDEVPAQYVARLACEKALTGARRHPQRAVLGADTTVVVDGEILGKPIDAADAARMIQRLSGRAHQVLTGVAVAQGETVRSLVAKATVWMADWPPDEVAAYVATAEPYDKAGAYAIQGAAGRYITRIDGDRDTIVGLPMQFVGALLGDAGLLRDADDAPYSEG